MAVSAHIDGDLIVFDGDTVGRLSPKLTATLRDRFKVYIEGMEGSAVSEILNAIDREAQQNGGLLTFAEVKSIFERVLG